MNVHKKTILLSQKLVLMGAAASVMFLHSSLAFAAPAPKIRLVRIITESGGVPLFRDPLQMSLNTETGELAVTNAGTGNVVVLRVRDEKALLRIDRRQGLNPPFGISLKADKTLVAGALKGGEIRILGPTGEMQKTWDPSRILKHPVRPGRMRSGPSDTTLIMDRQNDEVLLLQRDGTLRRVLGGSGKLDQIQDALFGPEDRIYTLCNGGQTVRVFSHEGKFLFGFGKHAGSPENFSFPSALSFDAKGRLWIVDAFQHKLKVFSSKGDFLFQFGGIGTAPGELFFPVDMAFDNQGRLWVLEKGTNRIKIYEVEDLKK